MDLHLPVQPPPPKVTRAVDEPVGVERMGHKPGSGQLGIVEVSISQTGTRDAHLTELSRREYLTVGVEDPQLRVGHRRTDDHVAVGPQRRRGAPDRRLGRTVLVDQFHLGHPPVMVGHQLRRAGLTRDDHLPQI